MGFRWRWINIALTSDGVEQHHCWRESSFHSKNIMLWVTTSPAYEAYQIDYERRSRADHDAVTFTTSVSLRDEFLLQCYLVDGGPLTVESVYTLIVESNRDGGVTICWGIQVKHLMNEMSQWASSLKNGIWCPCSVVSSGGRKTGERQERESFAGEEGM